MTDRSWVRLDRRRSWHAVRTPTRMVNAYRTLCGRTVVTFDNPVDELGAEKSCENCLRIMAREDDR